MPISDQVFRIAVEVRFRDLDAYGHVNNAVVFNYLETARIRFLGEHFSVMPGPGEPLFLVKRAECDYQRPIPLVDRVYIDLSVEEIRSSSFRFGYTLHDGAEVRYARAETVMVTVSSETGRPVRVPDWLRHILENPPAYEGRRG